MLLVIEGTGFYLGGIYCSFHFLMSLSPGGEVRRLTTSQLNKLTFRFAVQGMKETVMHLEVCSMRRNLSNQYGCNE
jgi:hypothetical protein